MQLLDILRTPRRWGELPAWARRRWRSYDPLLPGLLVAVRGNRATLEGCEFELGGQSLAIRSRFATGRYEAPERRFARELLDPAIPVIELGGCLGVLGCIVNKRLRDPARHVVVEANGALLDVIARHRTRNGARFAIEHAAIGYAGATVDLGVHPRHATASSAQRRFSRVVRAPATTLAAIADRHGFGRYQLLCDIEGAEQALIERERAHLADRVALAVVEFHPDVYGPAVRDRLAGDLAGALPRIAAEDDVIAFGSAAPRSSRS